MYAIARGVASLYCDCYWLLLAKDGNHDFVIDTTDMYNVARGMASSDFLCC